MTHSAQQPGSAAGTGELTTLPGLERLSTLSAGLPRGPGGGVLHEHEEDPTAHIAYTIYLSWVRRRSGAMRPVRTPGTPGGGHDEAALLLLQALIYASRSGNLSCAHHRHSICSLWTRLFPDLEVCGLVDRMQTEDIDPQVLKDQIMFKEEGIDIYYISSLMLRNPSFIEASYLDLLASVLSISPSLKRVLDQQARDCSPVQSLSA